MSPFLAGGDFHARSRFARFTIPEENGGLLLVYRWRRLVRWCRWHFQAPWSTWSFVCFLFVFFVNRNVTEIYYVQQISQPWNELRAFRRRTAKQSGYQPKRGTDNFRCIWRPLVRVMAAILQPNVGRRQQATAYNIVSALIHKLSNKECTNSIVDLIRGWWPEWRARNPASVPFYSYWITRVWNTKLQRKEHDIRKLT